MSLGTGEALVDVIEKSGLLSSSTLAKAIDELATTTGIDARADGARLLEYLVATDLLTPWQAGKLRQGRHKGFTLGNYKLLRHLGSGGMSSVYLAEHVHMKQLRALKVLPRHRVDDASYLARFYREARAAAALDHPNIVHAYDIASEGDVHFLVVEYIDGSDLQKLVSRKGPLSYAAAADVMRQVAAGLAHAHKIGVVHRDIKPANLFVDGEGVVKILDMGLARFTSEELEQQASLTQMNDERVLGTTNFLAPEQALDSHSVDGRADIYSLGCTFYYLLTGSPPFPTGTVAQRLVMHLQEKPRPMQERRPGVPAELQAIFDKMTAKKPTHRYQSAEEVVAAFRDWAAAQGNDAQGDGPKSGLSLRAPQADGDLHSDSQPGSKSKGASFDGERESGSSKDTDGGRGEATGIRRRTPVDDGELRLADDDAPTQGRDRPARNVGAAGSGSKSKPVVSVPKSATTAASDSAAVVAKGDTSRHDDFMAELMKAVESAAPPPLPGVLPGAANKTLGRATPISAAKPDRSAAGADLEGVSVKKDLDRLFRLHPIFASVVFGMFAVMLVLGLYYMIRSSTDVPAPANPSANNRD